MMRKTIITALTLSVFSGYIAYGFFFEHPRVAVVGGAGMVLVAAAAALDSRGW